MIPLIVVLLCIIFVFIIAYNKFSRELTFLIYKVDEVIEKDDLRTLNHRTSLSSIQNILIMVNKLIYEKRKEKIEMENREKNIKEMISNVSHDLKTPLTVIQGYAEMLNMNNTHDNENKEMLENIIQRITEVNRLITQFFDLAKIESGDDKPELSMVNVSNIAKETLINFLNILENLDFEIDIDIPDEDIYLLGNTLAFERIFNNLISNVISYGSDGKYIGLEIKQEENHINIKVSDKGIGISSENIDRIFNRSFVVDKSRNRGKTGNGLGLTIVNKLVEAMNGHISVTSQRKIFTVFTISFKID